MSPARRVWRSVSAHPWMQNLLAVVMVGGVLLAIYATYAAASLPDKVCSQQNRQTQALLMLIHRSTVQGARIRTPEEQARAEAFYQEAKRELEQVDCDRGWWP